jgi:hypothetical protein
VAASIRPFERGDLPEVLSLYELVARSGSRNAPPGMAAYFERFFLDHPWADPEIPSLVYEDKDGRVVGFLGSSVRRFRFDNRTIRAGCSGQLVTEPSARTQAAGAYLMREYMDGPQDLTFTDTASETVQRIWERLGGETFHLGCVGWVRVFRPWRFGAAYRARHDPAGTLPVVVGPVASALDAVSVRVPKTPFRSDRPETRGEELTPALLAAQLPDAIGPARLYPDYDEVFAGWLLREMTEVRSHGSLVARLVRDPGGQVAGWYVYYLRPGGISQVMQVAAGDRNVGAVLDHLFHDAEAAGAAALQGRLEPRLQAPLAARRALLHFSGYLPLVHARDSEVLAAIGSVRSLFTRMEGEWWMGHHLQPFADV